MDGSIKTLKELKELKVPSVYIRSYGYTEISAFNNIWQPFSKCLEIKFDLYSDGLIHSTYWIEDDPEDSDQFQKINGKWISLNDYDLCARMYD